MPVDVILNVYDLIDQTPICCGFFHTGVEIMGTEYSFAGGAGVYDCAPRSAQDGRFRESIVLGSVESSAVARTALDRIRSEFHGDAYSLIFKNCNDFSSAYVKALLGRDIPGRVNRLARLGRAWPIRCFLPPHLKAGGNNGATPAQAPLLTRPQPPLFQGAGNTLNGSNSSSQGAAAGSGGCRGIAARLRALFGGGGSEAAGSLACGEDGNARELRAAAAARRLSGVAPTAGTDVEVGTLTGGVVGGGGRDGAPMPNPWR